MHLRRWSEHLHNGITLHRRDIISFLHFLQEGKCILARLLPAIVLWFAPCRAISPTRCFVFSVKTKKYGRKINRIVEMLAFLVEEIQYYIEKMYDPRPDDRLFSPNAGFFITKIYWTIEVSKPPTSALCCRRFAWIIIAAINWYRLSHAFPQYFSNICF